MSNPPSKKNRGFRVNQSAGDHSVQVGGANYGAINYYNVPPQATPAEQTQAGINALRDGIYSRAIDCLSQALEREPSPTRYYALALALLQGHRPRMLTFAQAEKIQTLLKQACTSRDAPAHIFLLRAIIYYDFYIENGFREDDGTIETLFDQAGGQPFQPVALREMIGYVDAPDCPLVQWIEENLL